jgi:hypothetical protein
VGVLTIYSQSILISIKDVSQPPLKEHIHDVFELEALQELLKSRENKIIELERETAILRDEKTILQLEARLITFDALFPLTFVTS